MISDTAYRILALGDSYTIGEGVQPGESWPAGLARLLTADGFDVEPPCIVARTGWTTDELARGIDAASPAGEFDLVTLGVGVNNQYRKLSPGAFEREFGSLLDRAVDYAGGNPNRVVVLSIPDWGATPFARQVQANPFEVADEIDAFNGINSRLATHRGCHYVDVTQISRAYPDVPDAWAADGLHPSPSMYARWVSELYPLVREMWGG